MVRVQAYAKYKASQHAANIATGYERNAHSVAIGDRAAQPDTKIFNRSIRRAFTGTNGSNGNLNRHFDLFSALPASDRPFQPFKQNLAYQRK